MLDCSELADALSIVVKTAGQSNPLQPAQTSPCSNDIETAKYEKRAKKKPFFGVLLPWKLLWVFLARIPFRDTH